MDKRALLPLFLLFAEADFACVAANLFARDWFSSVRRGGLCLCSREFIRREYTPGIGYPPGLYYPLFLVRRGRRNPVQRRLTIAGDSCELAQDN